jgi:hypothetical protein
MHLFINTVLDIGIFQSIPLLISPSYFLTEKENSSYLDLKGLFNEIFGLCFYIYSRRPYKILLPKDFFLDSKLSQRSAPPPSGFDPTVDYYSSFTRRSEPEFLNI